MLEKNEFSAIVKKNFENIIDNPFAGVTQTLADYWFSQNQCTNMLQECIYQIKSANSAKTDELELLSFNQVTKLFHIGYDRLYDLIESGKLGIVNIDGVKKISRRELENFIEANTIYYSNSETKIPEPKNSTNFIFEDDSQKKLDLLFSNVIENKNRR